MSTEKMHAPVTLAGAGGPPVWWSTKGFKMQITNDDLDRSLNLVIANGEVARLTIKRIYGHGDEQWLVRWYILHDFRGDAGPNDEVAGTVVLTGPELFMVFMSIPKGRSSEDSIYVPAVEKQGKYSRKGQYLNIPATGTGLQGDPNISIFLSEEIRKAVGELFR